jgi:hypothetical protein
MAGIDFTSAFKRWKAGATIAELVAELKCSRSQMRAELTRHAGGHDAFVKLRSEGAGGKAEPFGGKRPARRAKPASDGADATTSSGPAWSDADVPMVPDTSAKAGWRVRREFRPRIVHLTEKGKDVGSAEARECVAIVYISPENFEYVQAKPNERADLIALSRIEGIPNTRLRLLDTSSLGKALRKEDKLVERGAAALERSRATKRAKREGRKAAKAGA